MSDEAPITGPVKLPANPGQVAQHGVNQLSSLGNLHKPPTEREYEHAAFDSALRLDPDEQVYAVLAHLELDDLHRLLQATNYLRSAIRMSLADRRGTA